MNIKYDKLKALGYKLVEEDELDLLFYNNEQYIEISLPTKLDDGSWTDTYVRSYIVDVTSEDDDLFTAVMMIEELEACLEVMTELRNMIKMEGGQYD